MQQLVPGNILVIPEVQILYLQFHIVKKWIPDIPAWGINK